jgi:hypothetical protein
MEPKVIGFAWSQDHPRTGIISSFGDVNVLLLTRCTTPAKMIATNCNDISYQNKLVYFKKTVSS